MMKKVNCVLLVDDDEATNYIHQHVIKEANFAEHIVVANNGQKALNYLNSIKADGYIKPDIIFLDINMPVMDGWEFLEVYKDLDEELKSQTMVVMISTSLNPVDKLNSESNTNIKQFLHKPLTAEKLQAL